MLMQILEAAIWGAVWNGVKLWLRNRLPPDVYAQVIAQDPDAEQALKETIFAPAPMTNAPDGAGSLFMWGVDSAQAVPHV